MPYLDFRMLAWCWEHGTITIEAKNRKLWWLVENIEQVVCHMRRSQHSLLMWQLMCADALPSLSIFIYLPTVFIRVISLYFNHDSSSWWNSLLRIVRNSTPEVLPLILPSILSPPLPYSREACGAKLYQYNLHKSRPLTFYFEILRGSDEIKRY